MKRLHHWRQVEGRIAGVDGISYPWFRFLHWLVFSIDLRSIFYRFGFLVIVVIFDVPAIFVSLVVCRVFYLCESSVLLISGVHMDVMWGWSESSWIHHWQPFISWDTCCWVFISFASWGASPLALYTVRRDGCEFRWKVFICDDPSTDCLCFQCFCALLLSYPGIMIDTPISLIYQSLLFLFPFLILHPFWYSWPSILPFSFSFLSIHAYRMYYLSSIVLHMALQQSCF